MKNSNNIFLIFLLFLLPSCNSLHIKERVETSISPKYKIKNYYTAGVEERNDIRRVLMLLPLDMAGGIDDLEKIYCLFEDELRKTKIFDIVNGQVVLNDGDKKELKKILKSILTTGIFDSDKLFQIARKYNVQAVLFWGITSFGKYQPYKFGVKLYLVNIRTGKIIWAVDEIFDSSRNDVKNLAKFYYYENYNTSLNPSLKWEVILESLNEYLKFVFGEVSLTYRSDVLKAK